MKKSQKNRIQVKNQKETELRMQALLNETKSFAGYLYYKDVDEFFISENKSIHDKINAYRLLLFFGFIYYKEDNIWRTEQPDLPDSEMMKMLKDIVPSDKLVFDYKKENISE